MNHPPEDYKVNFFYCEGDDASLGKNHAIKFQVGVNQGIAKFFLSLYDRAFSSQKTGPIRWLSMVCIEFLLEQTIVKKLVRQIPHWSMERLKAISQNSNFSLKQVQKAFVLPDLFPVLNAYASKYVPNYVMEVNFPTHIFGCASFFKKNSDGKFYYARNLDFPGVGYYEKFPIIQVVHQKESLKHLSFTSAGLPVGGVSSINEKKISLSLHQHYCLDVSFEGQLPYVIGEQIMRSASSLRDALEILRSSKVCSSWAFIIGDGKTGEAMIAEKTPVIQKERFLNDAKFMTHTNYFKNFDTSPKEFSMSPRMNWDNLARDNRLYQLLKGIDKDISIDEMIAMIADHWDPFWEKEKIFNRTVSQLFNIQSYVIDYSNFEIWFATGSSPIHLREYVKIDLNAAFRGENPITEFKKPGFKFKNSKLQTVKLKLLPIFKDIMDGDFRNSSLRLNDLIKETEEVEIHLVAAIINMKVRQYKQAKLILENCLLLLKSAFQSKNIQDSRHFSPEYFECKLYLARCLNLMGNKVEAFKVAEELIREIDSKESLIIHHARNVHKYNRRKVDANLIPFSTYAPFQ